MADEFKTGNEVTFKDGRGPKSKDTPAEFASDWHYEAHKQALERNLAGLMHRLAELKAMPATHPDQLAAAEQDVADARKALGTGAKAAKRRPRKAAESR